MIIHQLPDQQVRLVIDDRDYLLTITDITVSDASIGPYEFWGTRYVDPPRPYVDSWNVSQVIEETDDGERLLSEGEETRLVRRILDDPDLRERVESILDDTLDDLGDE